MCEMVPQYDDKKKSPHQNWENSTHVWFVTPPRTWHIKCCRSFLFTKKLHDGANFHCLHDSFMCWSSNYLCDIYLVWPISLLDFTHFALHGQYPSFGAINVSQHSSTSGYCRGSYFIFFSLPPFDALQQIIRRSSHPLLPCSSLLHAGTFKWPYGDVGT